MTWATESLTTYPGRCPGCGWHRATQGHTYDCRLRHEDPCINTTHTPRYRSVDLDEPIWECPDCDPDAPPLPAAVTREAEQTAALF